MPSMVEFEETVDLERIAVVITFKIARFRAARQHHADHLMSKVGNLSFLPTCFPQCEFPSVAFAYLLVMT